MLRINIYDRPALVLHEVNEESLPESGMLNMRDSEVTLYETRMEYSALRGPFPTQSAEQLLTSSRRNFESNSCQFH